jgi:hypothetical protein
MACCTIGPGTDGFATHHSACPDDGDGGPDVGGNTTGGWKLPPGGLGGDPVDESGGGYGA